MKSKNTKGFAMILAGVLIAVLAVGGFVVYNASQNQATDIVLEDSGVEMVDHSQNFEGPETVAPNNSATEEVSSNCQGWSSWSEYTNNNQGFSFCLPETFESVEVSVDLGDQGKQLNGHTYDPYSQIDMTLGAVTPVFVSPMEPNANMWKYYPTTAQLQNFSNQGYQNIQSVNSNGENYTVIYGQQESDMPFIGEGQVVVIFELESSPDFNTIGFMLRGGDFQLFMSMMDTVDIY